MDRVRRIVTSEISLADRSRRCAIHR